MTSAPASPSEFMKLMKLRPTTWIHVAAYLLSALVLGASAFPGCPSICMKWRWGSTRNCVVVTHEQFYLTQILQWPFEEEATCRIGEIPPFTITESWAGMIHQRKSNLLGIAFIESDLWGPPTARSVVVPLSFLLILPLTWMCSFYLFKLLRRFRAGRSDSPTPQYGLDALDAQSGE